MAVNGLRQNRQGNWSPRVVVIVVCPHRSVITDTRQSAEHAMPTVGDFAGHCHCVATSGAVSGLVAPATAAASARPFDGTKPELQLCRHSHVVVYFTLAQQCFSTWHGKQLLYSVLDFTTFRRKDARKHCKTRMKHQKTEPKHYDLRMKRHSWFLNIFSYYCINRFGVSFVFYSVLWVFSGVSFVFYNVLWRLWVSDAAVRMV
jgi:hypothetical protein